MGIKWMVNDTKSLAKAIWQSGILFRDDSFTLKQLFEIRDACMILRKFGLEDKDLLEETIKYINQKEENEHL